MKIKYSWHTDDAVSDEAIQFTVSRHRRRFVWVILLFAAVTIVVLYWQQARRVRTQETTLEDEVSASYKLWYRAVERNDLELFLYQLSDQNPRWKDAQKELFLRRRLLGRPELGLFYASEEKVPLEIVVDLAPDWQSAELSVSYPYRVEPEDANDAFVRHAFQHTYFFQRDEDRWLLSPPTPDFWGEPETEEMPGLTVHYPGRDAETVNRVTRDLHADLRALCAGTGDDVDACLESLQISVRFETNPVFLAAFSDYLTPIFRGADFILPTPALVGVPLDEAAYEALYHGFTARILETVRQNLHPPLALPQQDLWLLCFPPEGRIMQLFRYDVSENVWAHELPGRAFRTLMSAPGGNGVVLQARTRGAEVATLRLLHLENGRETVWLDEEMPEQVMHPTAWDTSNVPHLLLKTFNGSQRMQYRWLDPSRCTSSGCDLVELSGYTTWSSDGRHSLVLQETQLWRGDAGGTPLQPLGTGLNPFWLSDSEYGYVRYDHEAGAPSMQIVTATVGVDLPHIVLPLQALAEQVDPDDPPLLFANYVTVNPGDPDLLLLAATSIGAVRDKHHIFSLRVSTGDVKQLQQFDQSPRGYPFLQAPGGNPPFRLSPNGRWLLTTVLAGAAPFDSSKPTVWWFFLYDLQEHKTQQLTVYYPSYPADFPFYAWSSDGQWLAIVENGFLRLVAPGAGYQRMVMHPYKACYFAAWANG